MAQLSFARFTPRSWTIRELVRYLRQSIEADFRLQDLWVRGEVSNLSRPASGHLYFTLKDSEASLRCVMWRTEAERLHDVVRRRLDGEPAAYILGHWEFYGIDFYVDSGTLIPRPERELLVEEAIELVRRISRQGKRTIIADIGTGCGAIAISLALALPETKIYATDVSAAALKVAEVNCRRHGVNDRVELTTFAPVHLVHLGDQIMVGFIFLMLFSNAFHMYRKIMQGTKNRSTSM